MSNFLIGTAWPFALWFVHFSVVYAAHAALCSFGQTGVAHPAVIVFATVVAAGILLVALGRRLATPGHSADRWAGAAAAGLALIAVIWTALPALMIGACS